MRTHGGGFHRIGILVILAALVVLLRGRADASVNLPLHHWAYEAIERLVAKA